MRVRLASPDTDSARVADIYRPAVEGNYISFEESAPTADEMSERMRSVLARLPWLVAEDESGLVVGYAYASPFRPRPAYRFCVEDSIYLHPQARGTGVGRHPRELRLVQQPADVVDDRGAPRHRLACDGGLVGVNRERDPRARGELLDHRQHATHLFGGTDFVSTRTRGLSPDVEDVGAVLHHAQPGLHGPLRIVMTSAIGERVRRDVEDPHDERALAEG